MAFHTGFTSQRAIALLCGLLLPFSLGLAQEQAGPPPDSPDAQQQQSQPLLSPDQLDNLVAPVALYPDPLLSQVLAASTYPLEIVEAQQWIQQNSNLQGAQRIDAAKQQNWDPSVQALVAFPDVLRMLSSDVRWTTDLGNAFLAQQADVMAAVQRMRERARANGRLRSTPQQEVTAETQNGQSAIEIMPANPDVVYVPVYSPEYVWGPPVWGYYPPLWYPAGFGFGFGFGPGIFVDAFFPGWGGWGWGGWGWGCGWFGGGLFINAGFFHHYGFHDWGGGRGFGGRDFGGRGFGGRQAWAHDPGHRMGVAYPNRTVANRFAAGGVNRGGQFSGANRTNAGPMSGARFNTGRSAPLQSNTGAAGFRSNGSQSRAAGAAGGWQRFQGTGRTPSAAQPGARGFASPGSTNRTPSTPQPGVRGFASSGGGQRFQGAGRTPSTPQPGVRGFASSSGNWRMPPNNRLAQFGSASPSRQGSQNYGYRAPAQSYRGSGSTPSYRSMPSYSRPYAPAYSAPRGGNYYSAPRSFSAPRQSFSTPRSFSAPHYSGGGSSGGRSSFSGGHSGFSGGHSSGFSGGHSGGGGGGGRRR